jgi:alcohol dehydrogenase
MRSSKSRHDDLWCRRVELKPMVTHRFKLDQIEEAYELFANQRDGVLKVAIPP